MNVPASGDSPEQRHRGQRDSEAGEVSHASGGRREMGMQQAFQEGPLTQFKELLARCRAEIEPGLTYSTILSTLYLSCPKRRKSFSLN